MEEQIYTGTTPEPVSEITPETTLVVNEKAKSHLSVSSCWMKIMAILNCGMAVLICCFGFVMNQFITRVALNVPDSTGVEVIGAVYIAIGFLCLCLFVFPVICMLKFSAYAKKAIRENDPQALADALNYQKMYYVYSGIMMILGVLLCLLAVVSMFAVVNQELLF